MRLVFGCGTPGADAVFSDSVVLFISVLLDLAAVVLRSRETTSQFTMIGANHARANWRDGVLFYVPDKIHANHLPIKTLLAETFKLDHYRNFGSGSV